MAQKFTKDVIKRSDGIGGFQGVPAMCGESSYDIARRNGFAGTEAEFLAQFAPDALVQGVQQLKSQVAAITPSKCAAAHNGIWGGRDLTNKYTIDQICNMIKAGTFDDLFIGDYIQVTINTSLGGTEVVKLYFAEFDTFLQNGDAALTRHHAVMVPKDCFNKTAHMNPTNDTTGAYFSSVMHATTLPIYAAALQSALNNHILTYRSLLSTSMNKDLDSMGGPGWKGASNGWEWKDVQLRLMSEPNLYGTVVCGSSLYDVGCNNTQFALFQLNPATKIAGLGNGGGRCWYWLSAVTSAAHFAGCSYNGGSSYYAASGLGGVRPYFLIG